MLFSLALNGLKLNGNVLKLNGKKLIKISNDDHRYIGEINGIRWFSTQQEFVFWLQHEPILIANKSKKAWTFC